MGPAADDGRRAAAAATGGDGASTWLAFQAADLDARAARAAELALGALPDVTSVRALTDEGLIVVGGRTSPREISRVLAAVGLQCSATDIIARRPVPYHLEPGRHDRRFRVAAIAALLVFLSSLLPWFDGSAPTYATLATLASMIAAIGVAFLAGRPVWRRARRRARLWRATQERLLLLGFLAAQGHAALALLWPDTVSSATSRALLAVWLLALAAMLFGFRVGFSVRGQRRRTVSGLDRLRPRHVRREGAELAEVPLESVVVGDRLEIRAGERVPVDGIVRAGRAVIDESLMNGDQAPRERSVGMSLITGAWVVDGDVVIEATVDGPDGMLSRLIRAVRAAQRSQPRRQDQRLLDGTMLVLEVGVIALGAVTATTWSLLGAPLYGVAAVLAMVALALAPALLVCEPLARQLSVRRAADFGAVVRYAPMISALGSITVLMVEKAGIVTRGVADVMEIEPAEGFSVRDLFRYAASLEYGSDTQRAVAIVSAARERDVPLERVLSPEALPGGGARGRVAGHDIVVGSAGVLRDSGIPNALARRGAEIVDDGGTAVYIAIDGQAAGVIGLMDPPREGVAEAVERLGELGIRVVMVSGDDLRIDRAAADAVGINHVERGGAPELRALAVRALQVKGERVAVLGARINSVASMLQADVGVSMPGGVDLVCRCADVSLTRGSLDALADGVRAARAMRSNVARSVRIALGYQGFLLLMVSGLFAGSFGWTVGPALLMIASLLSTVTVVLNTLVLRYLDVGIIDHNKGTASGFEPVRGVDNRPA